MNTDANAKRSLGNLDPTFGDKGLWVIASPDPRHDQIMPWAINVDTSNRIYVAGEALSLVDDYDYFCVRLNTNGQVDASFGQDGYVIGRFVQGESAKAQEVLIQDDSKILLIGTSRSSVAVLRLNSDGSPDLSYGQDGHAVIPLAGVQSVKPDTAAASASSSGGGSHSTLLPDGKLLLVRSVDTSQGSGPERRHAEVIRLNNDGSLDKSFNGTGIVKIAHPEADITALLGSLEYDGSYVLVGGAHSQPESPKALFVRVLPSGALDPSFADNGYLVVESGIKSGIWLEKLILQTNRRLLGMGRSQGGRNEGVLISREMDGSANIQFNNGQPLLESLGALTNKWSTALVRSDGSILVHGSSGNAQTGKNDNAVACYTDAGRLDTSFGGLGSLKFPVEQNNRPAAFFTGTTMLFLGNLKSDTRFSLHCIARGVIG